MKNKKGFTLIELLAVIAILAILLILAIPNVIKMFNNAKVNSFVTEAQSIVNTAEKQYLSDQMNETGTTQYCYDGVTENTKKLNLSGNDTIKYNIFFNNGKITSVQVVTDSYSYAKLNQAKIDAGDLSSNEVKVAGSDGSAVINCSVTEDSLSESINHGDVSVTIKVTNGTIDGKTEVTYNNVAWGSSPEYNVTPNLNYSLHKTTNELTNCSYSNGKVNFTNVVSNTTCELILKETKLLTAAINPNPDSVPVLSIDSLKKTSLVLGEHGLYKSNDTTNNQYTYYFRGGSWCELSNGTIGKTEAYDTKAECETYTGATWKDINNWVYFAGQLWRIIRINEDGTIRLIMKDGIDNNTKYEFNTNFYILNDSYYSNTNIYDSSNNPKGAKSRLEKWYKNNLKNNYDDKLADTNYCEALRVKNNNNMSTGSATASLYGDYVPTFNCTLDDGNQKGILTSKIGLITYDEVVYAGIYYGKNNKSNYLAKEQGFWTMSPIGVNYGMAYGWGDIGSGWLAHEPGYSELLLNPVISLKSSTRVIGTGTELDPYVVE